MFDKSAIKENFSRAAGDYDKHAKLQEVIRNNAFDIAKHFFDEGDTILDIGCGTGALASENASWNIIGLDVSYGMCKTAQEKGALAINADAAMLPLRDDSFDSVFSSLFLQWASNPESVLKEILRVLKPSGTAVITTFTYGTLNELEAAFAAIDSAPHISNFVPSGQLLLKSAHIGGLVLEFDEQTYTEYYDDVLSLMRAIKVIGANNKHSGRKKGLMTPAQLKKIENAYTKTNGKIAASWKAMTLVIGKP